MKWFVISLLLPLAGLAAIALRRPKNRGKKKAPAQFVIAHTQDTRIILGAMILLMGGLVGIVALADPAHLNSFALYYQLYLLVIGLLMGFFVHTLTFHVSVDGETLTVTRRLKETTFRAADMRRLDVRKSELRVFDKEDKLLFSLSAIMGNLDLFFAYTHAHPGIRLTVEGKEIKRR